VTTFRAFQTKTASALQQGQSVMLTAPTGLGKSWAAALGFAQTVAHKNNPNSLLPLGATTAPSGPAPQPGSSQLVSPYPLVGTRLLHVLPIRALANSVRQDIRSLLLHQGLANAAIPSNWQELSDQELDQLVSYVPTIHHGQQQDSEIYAERVGITTIDQYLAAFAGAPLSFSSRSGHALAGAIIGSCSVFDEAHLLGPERGLPLLYAVLKQRQHWGVPSVVMTATLPKSVRDFLCDDIGLTNIEVSADDINARDGWRNVELQLLEKSRAKNIAGQIKEWQGEKGRVIAFVNTVDAAIELYRELQGAVSCPVHVIHSNYAPSHRKEREAELLDVFGEKSEARAILITTQVAEAGINISAPVVFSELAPVDSLIQRAGRCARFKNQPEGHFFVYEPERKNSHAPYNEDLVERTKIALDNDGKPFLLNWQKEQALVDDVLDDFYRHFIVNETPSRKDAEIKKAKKGEKAVLPKIEAKIKTINIGDALGLLDQTFLGRDPGTLENVLRDIRNVQVIVTSSRPTNTNAYEVVGDKETIQPSAFEQFLQEQNQSDPWKRAIIESIPISFGRFLRSANDFDLWELDLVRDEEYGRPMYRLKPAKQVVPNHTYVMVQSQAQYSPTLGLTLSGADQPPNQAQATSAIAYGALTPIYLRPYQIQDARPHIFQWWGAGRIDQNNNWHNGHTEEVFKQANRLIEHYRPFIQQLASKMQERGFISDAEKFTKLVVLMLRLGAIFHDIGKLNLEWQQKIGWSEAELAFWGKSRNNDKVKNAKGEEVRRKLPPHAFHALPALLYLYEHLGLPRYFKDKKTDDASLPGRMDRLAELMAMASARHHSLGSPDGLMRWQKFKNPDALAAIHELLLACDAEDIVTLADEGLISAINNYPCDEEGFYHNLDTPKPSEEYYPLYVIASRIIKVGDWEASGEKEVELCR
jgi:CRISPR-associated endonuclease/helicase Cas3